MLEILRQRRSIRKFQPRPVEAEKIDCLIEAALRSPSSRGRNPWEFVVITDRDQLTSLGMAKEHGSAFLAGAPLAIAVAADPDRCDVWIEDCSIAAIIIQLAAAELGLGSCWAQVRLRPHDADLAAEEYVRTLLGLPERYRVECVLGIGYPAEEKTGHPFDALPHDQVHRERFKRR